MSLKPTQRDEIISDDMKCKQRYFEGYIVTSYISLATNQANTHNTWITVTFGNQFCSIVHPCGEGLHRVP